MFVCRSSKIIEQRQLIVLIVLLKLSILRFLNILNIDILYNIYKDMYDHFVKAKMITNEILPIRNESCKLVSSSSKFRLIIESD